MIQKFIQSIILGVMVFGVTVPCYAVQPYEPIRPDPVLESWRWRSFAELKGQGAHCFVEDSDGVLWFGTDAGVVCYDGLRWTTYTPEDGIWGKPVNRLCIAPDGSLYAGTPKGISRFYEGTWQRIFPADGDLSWFVTGLTVAPDGSIWAGTLAGALHLQQDKVTLFTSQEQQAGLRILASDVDIVTLPDDVVPVRNWHDGFGVAGFGFIPSGFGIYGISRSTASSMSPIGPWGVTKLASGSPAESAGVQVGDQILKADISANALVLQLKRTGISQPILKTITKDVFQTTFRPFQVWDIFFDAEETLWFGLSSGEILCKKLGADWQLFTKADGLDVSREPKMMQSRDGAIWAITNDYGGVNRFDGKTWSAFSFNPNLNSTNLHTSIYQTTDGTVWIGGNGGHLHAYRNSEWAVYKPPQVPTGVRIVGLLEVSDGSLWMVENGQAAHRFDLTTQQWVTYEGLKFECEGKDGVQWFTHISPDLRAEDALVVQYNPSKKTWQSYGRADGLMAKVTHLLITPAGEIWATGSDEGTFSTARFDASAHRWHLKHHIEFNTVTGAYAAPDGGLWFGAGNSMGKAGGVLHFDPASQQWQHYVPPAVPLGNIYGIAQTSDGAVWTGSTSGLHRIVDNKGKRITEPVEISSTVIDAVTTDLEGKLWLGTRRYGVFSFDPAQSLWVQYGAAQGLTDNAVNNIVCTQDGHLWAVTMSRAINRFDGQQWVSNVLPKEITAIQKNISLAAAEAGAIWINQHQTRAIWYRLDQKPPETEMMFFAKEVSQSGNVTLNWQGKDPYESTPDVNLQYAYRLDGGTWSPFTNKTSHIFPSLPSGTHTFEVKSRDRDFNEDPSPALITFRVLPPVWQEPWFVALMALSVALIGLQTSRVIRRDQRLRSSNEALVRTNDELKIAKDEAEKSREEAEDANRAKSNFLANMSHEIRTPMNAILGYAQILDGDERLHPDHRKAIGTIGQSGQHLLGLINDILDISKIEAGQEVLNLSDFDLNNMLAGLGSMFDMRCRQKDLVWRLDTDLSAGYVLGDEGKLRQVLINLLGNAVKFTDRGSVTLTVKKQKEDIYCFEVVDTGQGIPKEKQAVIFEPFQQDEAGVKHGGTGLGLAIALRHVDMMGGTLTLASTQGKGSTFRFSLALPPSRQDMKDQDAIDWSRVSHLREGQTVCALVVDDVTNNIDILENMLTNIGVLVQTAKSGQEALEILHKNVPDIVFADIRMPNMNGAELLNLILKTYGENAPKVVATTASVFEHQRQEYLDLGFDAFINKPVQFEEVYACLADLLGVTFEFGNVVTDKELKTEKDWKSTRLSPELYAKLKSAAENQSITDLRHHIQMLEDMDEMQALASHLRGLAQLFDIEGIKKVLGDLPHE